MHHCLRITEILHLIFEYLVDEEVVNANVTGTIRHEDVAGLARTCKAFMDPALDILWRTQSSLGPLIMCLPAHFWTLRVDQEDGVVSLLQEPSHEDWLTLQRYSHRIRAFDCTELQLPAVCRNIVDTTFSPDLFDELFPRLHTLNVNIFSRLPLDPIQFLDHIRLPQLVRLRFRIPLFYQYGDLDLCFTPACMRSLQALTINAACIPFPTNAPLTVNFGQIPYLRSLYLSCHLDVSPSSLCELVHLQCLRDLTVSLPDGFDVDVSPSLQPILPSLQHITIAIDSLSQCTNLLSSITSHELGSVKIFHRSPATQNDIYQLFQEIKCIHERDADFNTLCVRYSCLTEPDPDPAFDLPRAMLTPLFACHRLRVLKLSSFATLDIDDSTIAQIALAWPDIEVLHLPGSQRNNARVTLEGICELLQGCLRLQSLRMQIDARILPEGEPEMQSSSLARLDITDSHMEDETVVERYIKTLAPQLEWLKMKRLPLATMLLWPSPFP